MHDDDDRPGAPAAPPARAAPAATLAFAVAFAAALAATVGFALQVPDVAAGRPPTLALDWVPSLGVDFALRLDGLAMLFCLLIAGIGALVFLYSFAYFGPHRDHARLHWLLLAFMVAMLGLVLADDVITLFVFWEGTTIVSFLLVGFDHANPKARRAALQALLVTGGGGLALLAGLVLLAGAAGTTRLSGIASLGPELTAHAHYPWILALVLVGAFTKSAQFPFHFWLPNAMAAPSPVSAYLHSATMVKAGVYLLARLHPALGGTELWFHTLSVFGAVTAVWSSLMALRQTDLKLMLAWTTVMGLGTITLFLASDARSGILAAITFLLVHALYKSALFLAVGNVDHESGTRELGRLGGLWRAMPMTALVTAAAAFSMAGFPPFLGFIGKELKYEGALAIAEEPWLVVAAAVSANAMMVAVALAIAVRVFLKGTADTAKAPREMPAAMWIGPLLPATGGLLAGVFPELLAGYVVEPAVERVLATETDVYLSLWHGINVPLMLSVLTVAAGVLLFWRLEAVRSGIDAGVARLPLTGDRGYGGLLAGTLRAARIVTNRIQSGSLSHYLTSVFGVLVAAAGTTLLVAGADVGVAEPAPVTVLVGTVAALIVAAAVVACVSDSRLLSICMLGIVGSGLALLFLVFGAIDVAITQLMVETLFVVMIAAVLPRLPPFAGSAHPGAAGGARDATIAIAAGAAVATVAIGVAGAPLDLSITRFYEAASLPEAYGANIVNVILVDFRALDTMGEIVVVAAAAMAVIALLKVRAPDAASLPAAAAFTTAAPAVATARPGARPGP